MSIFKKKDKPAKKNEIKLNVDTTGMTEEEIAALEAAAVLEEYDRESAYRNKLPKGITSLISAILLAFALFQIYTSIWTIPAQMLRSIHLAFALALVFLLYPAGKHMRKDKVAWYDYVLTILAAAVVLYIPFNYEYIIKAVGNYTIMDITIGVVGILLLFEACRRVVGMPILIIVCCFLLYALFGNFIPGSFGHRGYSVRQIVNHMYYTMSGVFGTPLGVSSTFIFLLTPGALLGAASLFLADAHAVTEVDALTPCEVLFFDEETLKTLMQENFKLAENYFCYLTGRIHFLTGRIESIASPTVADKLLNYLAQNAENGVVNVPHGYNRLASALSVSRASLYRVMDELEREGRILRKGKQILLKETQQD